ncbi:hypothetical protein KC367_g167 [Hortaea werneckii]|nr:hypothetical protein KC367_g167 [Hortaea werneckii]
MRLDAMETAARTLLLRASQQGNRILAGDHLRIGYVSPVTVTRRCRAPASLGAASSPIQYYEFVLVETPGLSVYIRSTSATHAALGHLREPGQLSTQKEKKDQMERTLGGTCNVRRSLRVLAHLAVLWRAILLRLRRSHLERLLEIGNDIVNMLCSHRYPDQVLQSTSAQVRDELEVVDDLTASVMSTLDPEREHATEPPGKLHRILGVTLAPQTQSLDPQEQLLGSEGIQRCAKIPQNLHAQADDESDGAEFELTRVNDDAADGGAMSAYPFRCGMDYNVRSMINGPTEIASKSGTLYLGLPIVSTYTAFVFSSIAFLKSSALSPDTNLVVTPSRGIKTLNWFCDALFEDVDGRVHDTGIDVAELFETEESRAMGGIVEDIGGGFLPNKHSIPAWSCSVSNLGSIDLKESLLTLPALPCAVKVKPEVSWEVLSSLAVNASADRFSSSHLFTLYCKRKLAVPEEAHYCKRDHLFAKSKFCCIGWCHLTSLRQHRITPSPSLLLIQRSD